ncbi:hypothetical protein SKAU_G00203140 [Synaphobranchus kaupii]|uniref:Uncharacterized protein n=1 Tax=Synaphobranchus kaupii TaxID=118154 RepID=A0A9Q1IYK6_SYNKA|nr:hypothetical protein SKAU_G00203140 [Synaphobranchus kaupii]
MRCFDSCGSAPPVHSMVGNIHLCVGLPSSGVERVQHLEGGGVADTVTSTRQRHSRRTAAVRAKAQFSVSYVKAVTFSPSPAPPRPSVTKSGGLRLPFQLRG